MKQQIFLQLPCSASDAALWMEQTITQFETGKNSRNELILPLRLNQQHKLEEYSIDTCSKDQKKHYHAFYSI